MSLVPEKSGAFWETSSKSNKDKLFFGGKIYELTILLSERKVIYILIRVGPLFKSADVFFVSAPLYRQNVLRKKKDIAYILTCFQPPFKNTLCFRSFSKETNKRNNKQLLEERIFLQPSSVG